MDVIINDAGIGVKLSWLFIFIFTLLYLLGGLILSLVKEVRGKKKKDEPVQLR